MQLKKIILQAIIITYCFVTLAGLVYTTTHYSLPFVPKSLIQWSYFMMAPFRGYDTINSDLRADGKRTDGTWEEINLDRYYPLRKPEQIKMKRLDRFLQQGEERARMKYRELAKNILTKEPVYISIRLTWETWPMDPKGWDAKRIPEVITLYPLSEVSL